MKEKMEVIILQKYFYCDIFTIECRHLNDLLKGGVEECQFLNINVQIVVKSLKCYMGLVKRKTEA